MKNLWNLNTNLSGKKRKEKVLTSLSKMELKNEGVKNIHRLNPNNVGDYFCAPHLYFDKLKGSALDISACRSINKNITDNWKKEISEKSLVIGGGGLLNLKHFHPQMKMFEELAEKGKKVVLWGPGHNEVNIQNFQKNKKYWIDISKFPIAGTRDYSMPGDWVPCVSCMHPIFDEEIKETQEIGIIFNAKSVKDKSLKKKLDNYPSSSNTTNLRSMITFIGKTHILITNSYHAMYWGILMGKKVISIPATSKFLDFKYPTVISTFEDFENQFSKATSYTGVLEECREINIEFSKKVFEYLEI